MAQPETRTIDKLRRIDAAFPRLRPAGQRTEIRATYLLFPSSPPGEWHPAIPSREPLQEISGIFMPSPVPKYSRTVRQATPRECRDRVDDLPKFIFRIPDLL